jgi:hypothetical protein
MLGWTTLALLGLALAAGVTLAASELSSQKIGLQSEPLDAGRDLAPPDAGGEPGAPQGPRTTTTESDGAGGADDAGSGGSNAGSGGSGDSAPAPRSDDDGGGGESGAGGEPRPGGQEADSDD